MSKNNRCISKQQWKGSGHEKSCDSKNALTIIKK